VARNGFAVNAQAGDSSVGINLQTQMGKPGADFDCEWVAAIASQRSFRDDLDPLRFSRAQPAFFARVRVEFAQVAAFEGESLWKVAREKTGVHYDSADDARQTQPEDAPVKAGCTAAARLPAIHPLSAISVFPLDEYRIGFLD
jgi:hypothetical protein